jgi:hypothetical protein
LVSTRSTGQVSDPTEEPEAEEPEAEEPGAEEATPPADEPADEAPAEEEPEAEEHVGPPTLEERVATLEALLGDEGEGREAGISYVKGRGFHLHTMDRLFSLYIGGLFIGEYLGVDNDHAVETRAGFTSMSITALDDEIERLGDVIDDPATPPAAVASATAAQMALMGVASFADHLDLGDAWEKRGIVGDQNDTNSFDVDELHLQFTGHAFTEDLGFNFELEADDEVELLRGYIDWESCEWASFRLGQMDVPIGRQLQVHEGDLQFGRDNLVTDVFTPGQDVGLMVHDVQEVDIGAYEYAVGIWNGNGAGSSRNDYSGFMWGARAAFYPVGFVPYVESDWETANEPKLGIGTAILRDRERDDDLGSFRDRIWEVDAVFTCMGLFAQAELFFRKTNFDFVNVRQMGWYIQGGYMALPDQLEILGRLERIDWQSKATGLSDTWELATGFAYYWDEHHLKMVFEAGRNVTAVHGGGEVDTDFIRAALQLRW